MPIASLYVQRSDEPEAATLFGRLRNQGHTALKRLSIERLYRLEYDPGFASLEQIMRGGLNFDALKTLLVNPVFETSSTESALKLKDGPIVEVGYRAAVTDPETPSIIAGARALGQNGLVWARLLLRYQFEGLSEAEALSIAQTSLSNPVVQEVFVPKSGQPERRVHSLRPTGVPDPVRGVSFAELDDAELARLSESSSWYAPLSQMKALQTYERKIGRPFTDAEVEIVVQSWSDHCYHTTWKSLGLLDLLINATASVNRPDIVSVFKDNAGGLLLNDEWVVTIKGETHNFPSSIAPFGGVATKHGGVIRDTVGFGKGGFPIGGSTIMGTLDPRTPDDRVPGGALPPGYLLRESIRATAYYCNPMGIPMMYPVYRAHPGYPKCLALGHSIGLIPREYALKDPPVPGDLVLLLGGRTGRDGLHGATASSAEMTGETLSKESAAVQIGHPITERAFVEAIPRLRDAGCIRSITDLGAGGLSCAAGEMGERTGIRLDLNAVPLKDASLSVWEILLSESQERMLVAIPPEKMARARSILVAHDVESTVIGEFTDTGHYEAFWRRPGERSARKVVDLDMLFLWGTCPIDPAEVSAPESSALQKPQEISSVPPISELRERALRLIGHYHVCDQSAAGFQFDSTVQGRTVLGPYAGKNGRMPTDGFVSAPLRGETVGVGSTVAYNPFYGEIDPVGLTRLAVIEAVARAVAIGIDPSSIALCDNFYTPRATPEINWALGEMVKEAARLSLVLGMPFISGKDSSSGTFRTDTGETIDVPLTFVVSTIGRVPDVRKVPAKALQTPGDRLFLVGPIDTEKLGGSVYLDTLSSRGDSLHDLGPESVTVYLALFKKMSELIAAEGSPVRSVSAIAEGGLFRRLFEMAQGGELGARIDLSPLLSSSDGARWDGALFAEAIGSFVVALGADARPGEIFPGLEYREIGQVTVEPELTFVEGERLVESLSLADLTQAWESVFPEVVL